MRSIFGEGSGVPRHGAPSSKSALRISILPQGEDRSDTLAVDPQGEDGVSSVWTIASSTAALSRITW